eukprot:TRINITY_DN446_c0_g2_i1.p1 TRINITY_DN446_c0_g2~~TRINITY_DN446_c0_g2_i1.p1  ORF type:complete len:355 (-),score=49.23 TRINITY_DN446_c0_g2_i1:93-1157(-)
MRSVSLSLEQWVLLVLVILYHVAVYTVLPPEAFVETFTLPEVSHRQAIPQPKQPCFASERQPPKPWDELHPCVIERKNGSGTQPFPTNPAKSIFLIEHSNANNWKIAYSILNLLTSLKNDWRVQIKGPLGSRRHLEIWLQEYIQSGQVAFLDPLPEGFRKLPDYNILLRSVELWASLWGDWVLVTQTDAGVCPLNSRYQLEDFFCYDSIGAAWPWNPQPQYQAGNGGFALRRRSMVLELVSQHPLNDFEKQVQWEDTWFHDKLLLVNATLPHVDVQTMFSMEAFVGDSYGFHQAWVFNRNDSAYVRYYCPEGQAIWQVWYPNDRVYDVHSWPSSDPFPDWSSNATHNLAALDDF